MHPILLHLGSRNIHFYSVFYPTAAFLGILLSVRRAKIEGFDEIRIMRMFFFVLAGALLGSRALDVVTRFSWYMAHPAKLFSLGEGVVFYGGYLGAIAGGWLYLRHSRHPILPILDITSTYLGLGLAVHRSLACFMAGCCYGCPTSAPWGVIYPEGSMPAAEYGRVPLHPTQLYEAGLGLVIFFALVAWRKRRVVYGEQFALQLYIYSIGRFVIELFRGDTSRGFYGPLSTSQWVSVGLFAAGVGLTALVARRRRLLREGKLKPKGISRPHDYKPLVG